MKVLLEIPHPQWVGEVQIADAIVRPAIVGLPKGTLSGSRGLPTLVS